MGAPMAKVDTALPLKTPFPTFPPTSPAPPHANGAGQVEYWGTGLFPTHPSQLPFPVRHRRLPVSTCCPHAAKALTTLTARNYSQ